MLLVVCKASSTEGVESAQELVSLGVTSYMKGTGLYLTKRSIDEITS